MHSFEISVTSLFGEEVPPVELTRHTGKILNKIQNCSGVILVLKSPIESISQHF